MAAAARWLEGELSASRRPDERLLLVVDEFDPHEPFDTPSRWSSRYDPTWEGPRMIWPPYARSAAESGLSEREGQHLRAQYGAKLSMIDHWLGRVLDVVDRHDAWGTTAFVLCTDHGHYLGERGLWGKPAVAVRPELGHIPLLVSWPGVAPGTCAALTTTVDLHATLCDAFGVTPSHRTHGRSLVPLLRGDVASIRDWALCGVWGREVHVADARRTYARAPVAESNRPLSMWSNRWSTMPVHAIPGYGLPKPDERATIDFYPGSSVPTLRQPFDPSDDVPFWANGRFKGDLLYDRSDPSASHRPDDVPEMAELLRTALLDVEAPAEQLVRLGLA
jgi:hypothetical protein